MSDSPIPRPSQVPPQSSPSPTLPLSNRLAAVQPDDKGSQTLVELIVERSGMKQVEIAARMGVSKQALNQYYTLRRSRPSVQWLAKLLHACGGRLLVEFPPQR